MPAPYSRTFSARWISAVSSRSTRSELMPAPALLLVSKRLPISNSCWSATAAGIQPRSLANTWLCQLASAAEITPALAGDQPAPAAGQANGPDRKTGQPTRQASPRRGPGRDGARLALAEPPGGFPASGQCRPRVLRCGAGQATGLRHHHLRGKALGREPEP